MDNRYKSNETLLDFSSIFWDFLSQWKAVLLFSLVTALLVAGLKYKLDYSAYKAVEDSAVESNLTAEEIDQRIQETLDALSREDRSAVNYAVGFHSMIEDKKKYQSEAPVMHIDPNHVEVLVLSFRISGDTGSDSLSILNDGYISSFNDESLLEAVSNAAGIEKESDYVKELLSFSDPSTTMSQIPDSIIQDDGMFNVFIIIPSGSDSNTIKKALINVFEKKCSELSKTIMPHSIELVSSDSAITACSSIMEKQSDLYYSVYYLTSSLNSSLAEFNEQQTSAYNTILHMQSVSGGNTADQPVAVETPIKPDISKRVLILGFILGIIVYFFIYFIYLLFTDKVTSPVIVKKILRKRLLGEFYSMKQTHSIIESLFFSPAIFKRRYFGKTDSENQAASVAHILEIISSKNHINDISLISTYLEQNSFTNNILSYCKRTGLSMDIIEASASLDEVKFKDASCAVIAVSNHTTSKQLFTLNNLLNYYGVNVLGFIYTSDR